MTNKFNFFPMIAPRTYAIANNLVGFKTNSLRVRITRVMNASQVEVITCSLSDAGTWLIIHPNQLSDFHS